MKIRTGFVSNSSSSSFLVCYNSIEDLKRFLPFKGAKEFLNDIKSCSDKKAVEFLIQCLELSAVYFEIDWDTRKNRHPNNDFTERSPISKLYDTHLISEKDYFSFCDFKTGKCLSNFRPLAKRILKNVKEKYSELAFVEYVDDAPESGEFDFYMEYDFMNFLSSDPEKKVHVVTFFNH